jgi:threonine/homoserine/homoserine lactone efflux protein
MLRVYFVTWVGLVLAQLTPGPNLLAVASAALGAGRRQALFVALGIALTASVWLLFSAFALAAIVATVPAALTALKLVGGAYLIVVAYRGARAAWRGGEVRFREGAVAVLSPGAAFRCGLLVNLTNPKSALAWGAIATFMYGAGLSAGEVAGFAPIGSLSAFAVYAMYAMLFSGGRARRLYARFWRAFEALFAAAFGGIGATLVADGVSDVAGSAG